MRDNNFAAKQTLEMFPESQAGASSQSSASTPIPAQDGAARNSIPAAICGHVSPRGESPKAPTSSRASASTEFPSGFYVLDPGDQAGLLLPDGTPVLHGTKYVKKTDSVKQLKGFKMSHVLAQLKELPRRPIFTETAYLPNGRGLTAEFIAEVEAIGFPVYVRHTRHTPKGRAEVCASGHDIKANKCDACTTRDLLSLREAALRFIAKPCGQFYLAVTTMARRRCGSKNVSGTPAAELNTRLNRMRFEPVPYSSTAAPAWLKAELAGDDMAAATIDETAKQAVALGWGYRGFRRLLGDYENGRSCLGRSNLAYHYAGSKKAYTAAAKRHFRELRDAAL